jgi:hypothetical protein
MGHAYGAQTANHMFIVDRGGVLVYAGGIDDGETMDPKRVLRARSYVRPALEDLLAGRPVKQATTDPAGCSIAHAGEDTNAVRTDPAVSEHLSGVSTATRSAQSTNKHPEP